MASNHLPQLPQPLSFAAELIKARNELGYTQSQLSTKSGLSLSAIKAYEAGRNMPGARELVELCQALQVSPNKLLFGRELPFENSSINSLADSVREDEAVVIGRMVGYMHLLAHDERIAIQTLAHSIAVARHKEEKVTETLATTDMLVGFQRAIIEQSRDAVVTGKPIKMSDFQAKLESFMARQGHIPKPKKLPKK